MNPIETLAVANAIETKNEKLARSGVVAGTYNVDVTVRVHGTVKVGEDTEKTPTASIPVKEVLALFIARSGCTREASIALLRDCLTDALSQGVTGAGAIEAVADIDNVFKAAANELVASLPKTPVKGSVKASLVVEEIAVSQTTENSTATENTPPVT